MADKELDSLPAADALTGAETALLTQTGNSRKVTLNTLKTWVLSGLTIAWGSVTGKPTVFPPDTHTHAESEITGLVSDLASLDSRLDTLEAAGPSATNLSYTASTRVVASDTGTDATLPIVTSTDAGLAPASGGGTTNYLRADGSWAAPPGSGAAATNLSYDAATRVVASDTGTDATLPLMGTSNAGLVPTSPGGTDKYLRSDGSWATAASGGITGLPFEMEVALSDEGTNLAVGTAKVTFVMPRGVVLSAVWAFCTGAPTGAAVIANLKENGTTIFSTKPQVASGANLGTSAVLSDANIAAQSVMSADIDQVGSGAAGYGLKLILIGTYA